MYSAKHYEGTIGPQKARRHLHYSEITACALYVLITCNSNFGQAVMRILSAW